MAKVRSSIPRSLFTEAFVDDVKTSMNLPVGLYSFPDETHGWGSIDPNRSDGSFIPYGIVGVGSGSPEGGALGDSAQLWRLSYRVTIAGVHVMQTEDVADLLRAELMKIPRAVLENPRDNSKWKIMEYSCVAIGDVTKISSAEPDYYIQTDSYAVRVTKG